MKQMTLEEISKAAASGAFRKIPVSREIYSDIRTPVETLKVLQGVSSHCYMLESVEDKKQWGRHHGSNHQVELLGVLVECRGTCLQLAVLSRTVLQIQIDIA